MRDAILNVINPQARLGVAIRRRDLTLGGSAGAGCASAAGYWLCFCVPDGKRVNLFSSLMGMNFVPPMEHLVHGLGEASLMQPSGHARELEEIMTKQDWVTCHARSAFSRGRSVLT